MERVALSAETREMGKGAAKRMRATGRIPAILYGRRVGATAISVDGRDLEKAVKTKAGMNVLIDLQVGGGDSGLALIRDFQADPFRREFLHVDFQAISLTEKIEIEVPVVLTGESPGVKEGGVVEQLRRTIELRCLPQKIPEKIEADISNLKIGNSIHANELVLPEGVEFPRAPNYTIVTIVPPAKEEVAAPPVAAEVPVEGAPPAEAAGATAQAPGAEAPPATAEAKGKPEAKGKGEKKEGK